MKVYDFEHHACDEALLDYLSARTDGYPYIDENNNQWYNETFFIPLNTPGINSSNTLLTDITDFDDIRISNMDKAGVTNAFLCGPDVLEILPREDCIRLARARNDEFAKEAKRHPNHFLGTFCLPMPYVDDALEELDRAVNELGLVYWHTHSSYGYGKHLYDEEFEPLFAKLAEYDIPFYVHPTFPDSEFFLDSGATFAGAGFGYGSDVMKTTMRIFMRGVFDRYPNLKMILGHMAEFYPYFLDRLDSRFGFYRSVDPFIQFEKNFADYFMNGNVFMATSGVLDPLVVKFVIDKLGSDCILFGSDYPFENIKEAHDFIANLDISDEDKEKIFYKNAEKYILKK